jgi:DNA-binding beta-propeller fold protein YncE
MIGGRRFAALQASALLVFSFGCGDDMGPEDTPPPSAAPAVFAVNSLGETLSRILIEEGEVAADAFALGEAPQGIAVLPGGREALVVSSRSNRVDLVDLDALAVRRSIDIGPGSNPYGVAVAATGAAYVSCFLSDEVVRLDVTGGTVAKRIPVGRGPEGVLYVEDEGDVYVALTGYTNIGVYGEGAVEVIGSGADTVRARLVVGKNPQSVTRAPDGTVHVACTGNYGVEAGRVFVIDPAVPAVVDSIPIGGSPVAVLMLAGDLGLTAGYEGGLKRYDPAARIAEEMVALAGDTWFTSLVYDAADSLLYVSDFDDSMVHVVDPWADVHVRSFRVGHGPVALAIRR